MVNRRRGETELVLGERRYRLCLTLGALAELEAAFGVDDLASLAERFNTGRLAAGDVISILTCALRGGGHEMSEAEVAALHGPDGVSPLVEGALAALEAAFGVDAPNPPQAQTG
ncbi:gene transfer agent family protein [Saliniramus sp.]|uniref:gene transfer agent family protein n=1 Tax=Saliniramus sp. TaxID=2986772 RepID=UPI002CA8BB60|nr:gene transfer agent family protein [Saliniramus sp.]HMB10962.1 gene transfer agent family protein [Saliniramus sp.]